MSQLRGAELRRHMLFAAKDVFLESGYERASMDTVAARAGTSKRSLYAHFANKEALLRAVLDLVRELYLDKLRTPEAYAAEPVAAVTAFCGRFQQLLTWEPHTRTCRLSITAAELLPGSGIAYFDAIFASTHERLAGYLARDRDPAAAAELARDLLDRTVLPRLFRTLLGVREPIRDDPGDAALAEQVDLPAIEAVVTAALTG